MYGTKSIRSIYIYIYSHAFLEMSLKLRTRGLQEQINATNSIVLNLLEGLWDDIYCAIMHSVAKHWIVLLPVRINIMWYSSKITTYGEKANKINKTVETNLLCVINRYLRIYLYTSLCNNVLLHRSIMTYMMIYFYCVLAVKIRGK